LPKLQFVEACPEQSRKRSPRTTVVITLCHNAVMTSSNSSFAIHSLSISTPTESDSSFHALHSLTDHQIVPLPCFEPAEEMEEKEIMSTNSQILTTSSLERCFSQWKRGRSGAPASGGGARRCSLANHFTSTSIRIHGWMQHWNRCFPFDRPVISRWLP